MMRDDVIGQLGLLGQVSLPAGDFLGMLGGISSVTPHWLFV